MRCIDADKLTDKIFPMGLVDGGRYTINAKAVKYAIDQTPTADVAEVVRCKECVHCQEYMNFRMEKYLGCNSNGEIYKVSPTHFCAYGERKGGEGE